VIRKVQYNTIFVYFELTKRSWLHYKDLIELNVRVIFIRSNSVQC